jgi:hypothetical protein
MLVVPGCQSTPAPDANRSITHALGTSQGTDAAVVEQLEFLDRLESKPVTTWDEMLAGILISANKRVGPDYSARLGQARSFGLVALDAPENGDTPATPAAFARALLRARGERFDPRANSEALVTIAQQRGLLPAQLSANDILRGQIVVGSLVALGEPTTRSSIPPRSALRAGSLGPNANAAAAPLRPATNPAQSSPQPVNVARATRAQITPPGPTRAQPAPAQSPPAGPAVSARTAANAADAFADFEQQPPAAIPAPSSSSGPAPAPAPSAPAKPAASAPSSPGNSDEPRVRPEPLPPRPE